MNKIVSKIVDSLLIDSEQKLKLKTLEKVFNTGIPFNAPHKFKFLEMSDKKTRIKLPYKRVNMNHLRGIHACAMATLGEYPAGLTLLKKFGSTKYRLIMTHLEGDYLKQGRTDLIGIVEISTSEIQRMEKELEEFQKSEITVETKILNTHDEVVSVIRTNWQLKSWDAVTFKG